MTSKLDTTDDEENTLLHSWREEQHEIASKVIIPPSIATYQSVITPDDRSHNYQSMKFQEHLLIGGVDVSFPKDEATEDAVAVYVILKYNVKSLHHDGNKKTILLSNHQPEVVHRSHKYYKLTTPYIPSYLAYREIDPLLELISHQRKHKPHLSPNVIFVDGNGQWHDRYAGLACFVGVKTGIPSVGVGKSFYSLNEEMRRSAFERLMKEHVRSWYNQKAQCSQDDDLLSSMVSKKECRSLIVVNYEPEIETQQQTETFTDYEDILVDLHQEHTGLAIPMYDGVVNKDEALAYALVGHGGSSQTTKSKSSKNNKKEENARGSKNPLYISCGSHISLLEAVSLVASTSIVRIPEPIREADLYGRQLVRDLQK